MMGYTQLIESTQLPAAGTPANSSWYLAADPAEVDTIEIGFVGGQVNPAMFIQDNPLYGLNFTQDAISYKRLHTLLCNLPTLRWTAEEVSAKGHVDGCIIAS